MLEQFSWLLSGKKVQKFSSHAARLPTASIPCTTPQLILKTPFYKIDVAKRTLFKPLCFQNSDYKSTLTVDYLVQH